MSDELRERNPQLSRFACEVQRWGQRTNLVGNVEPASIAVHVSDSIAAAAAIPHGASVVDLGSGAGFPGIPIAVARGDVRVTLVESRERRVHFLRHAVRVLGIDVQVRRERFEKSAPGEFDVVCLRGVGPLGEVLPQAARWARSSGEVWVWTRETPHALAADARSVVELGERGRVVAMAVRSGKGSTQ